MPLLINGRTFSYNKQERDEIKEKFGIPIELVYASKHIKTNKKSGRLEMPEQLGLPCEATVVTEGKGADVITYYQREIPGKYNEPPQYEPKTLEIKKSRTIGWEDLDLIYFLYFCSPYVENGKAYDKNKSVHFKIKDDYAEAVSVLERDEIIADVEYHIFNKKSGLPELQIREIAKAYYVPNVDDKKIEQVRIELRNALKKLGFEKGYKAFHKEIKVEDIIESKRVIQEAIDYNVLYFDNSKRPYKWVTITHEDGKKKEEKLVVVSGSRDSKQTLVDNLKANSTMLETLKELVADEKVRRETAPE